MNSTSQPRESLKIELLSYYIYCFQIHSLLLWLKMAIVGGVNSLTFLYASTPCFFFPPHSSFHYSCLRSIPQAIEELGTERIGHGYKVLNDPSVYQLAKERGVHFEVKHAPGSSYTYSSSKFHMIFACLANVHRNSQQCYSQNPRPLHQIYTVGNLALWR